MLRAESRVRNSPSTGSSAAASSTASTPGPMGLMHVEPAHDHVEQPVLHRAHTRRVAQSRLVGDRAEPHQDRELGGETRPHPPEVEARHTGCLHHAGTAPAVQAGLDQNRRHQRRIELAIIHKHIFMCSVLNLKFAPVARKHTANFEF